LITHVDYTLKEAINNYQAAISNYSIFYYILVAVIVFGIIILINLNSKTSFYLTFISWIIAIISIFYYRGLDMFNHIDTIFNWHFYQNIFCYYWNIIIGLLIMHIVLHSSKHAIVTKFIIIFMYILTITNFVFSLYITNVVGNSLLLSVGNIASMIIIGNVLLFVIYIYLIVFKIVNINGNKK